MVKAFLKSKHKALLLVLAFNVIIPGCGYTTKSNLPEDIKTIYIAPVKNAIDFTSDITDKKGRYKTYHPGLEVDLTNAIINRFIFDGNLKVVKHDNADAVVEGKLLEYYKDPLRYTGGDDVQEYRLNVSMEVVVYKSRDRKVLYRGTITGDADYFLSGSRATSEDEALDKAVEDVAKRVVEQTVEVW